jgi:uracil-DNA glycosylase
VSHDEARSELRSLLGAVRALVEVHRAAGGSGLPGDGPAVWPPPVADLLAPLPLLAPGEAVAHRFVPAIPAPAPEAAAPPVAAAPLVAPAAATPVAPVTPAAAPLLVAAAPPPVAAMEPPYTEALSLEPEPELPYGDPSVAPSFDETPAKPPYAAVLQAVAGRTPSPPALTPEPPFGITALPPETEPSSAAFSEAPPAVTPVPALRLVESPVEAVTPPPAPASQPSLFDDEPAQGFLFGPSDVVEARKPKAARGAGLPADLPAPRTEAAHHRLTVLAQRISGCTLCVLHQGGRKQTVFARGNPNADLCFIGEAPGADEDQLGEPFVGRSGQLLDRMIAGMGMTQDEVYVTNICRCRPPGNRTPTPEEMSACMPYLHEQLALVQPRVIVALGATASKALLATSLGIRALRGTWKLYRGVTPVMPTFHPSYLLRETEAGNLDAKREVWKDLQAVLERLGRSIPQRGKK